MIGTLDNAVPDGPLDEKWAQHKFDMKLVNPEQPPEVRDHRRRHRPGRRQRRRHARRAGLQREGLHVPRLARGGRTRSPPRAGSTRRRTTRATATPSTASSTTRSRAATSAAREANVYRLAEVSVNIIDQMVAQGVPFAREYGGLLDNRSFGGAQVSRTFYARGQTGQQLLLGAYQQLTKQVHLGTVELHTRSEMLDLVVMDGRAAGIVVRDLVTGEVTRHSAHAVVLCTGGYGNVFYLSTNAMACNVTAAWRAHRRGALFANPCFTQIHPTCIPASDDFQSKLTLMSESLRNDGRIWVPKNPDDERSPDQIPEADRDYFLERKYPSFGNLVPRDVASAQRQDRWSTRARASGPLKNGVYLDFAEAIEPPRPGRRRRALRQPLRDVRAHHRRGPVQGADAHLPGRPLHDGRALGRLRPDDQRPRPVRARRGQLLRPRRQPPRRLGADAGPGRRLLRAADTIGNYLAPLLGTAAGADRPPRLRRPREADVDDRVKRLPRHRRHPVASTTSTASSARSCGTTAAWRAPSRASRRRCRRSPPCTRSSAKDLRVLGDGESSTSRSRRPAASPTSSSSASSCAATPSTARSPAAATSARSTRPRRARPCATTSTSPTSRRGSGRATPASPAPQGAARVRERPPRQRSYK